MCKLSSIPVLLLTGASVCAAGISLNEDDSNFFASFPAEKMTSTGVVEFIANYTQGQVREVLLNPNAMRTSYASRTGWDPIWTDCVFEADDAVICRGRPVLGTSARWIRNAKTLADAGINPYQLWVDAIRQSGRSPWISMRMNDLHVLQDEEDFLHNDFWRQNPQFRLVPGAMAGLDYSHPEVRAHALALIDEYLELFDLDGLELDWMRFPHSLRGGHELHDAAWITEFMREVRSRTAAAAQRRGHAIEIGVRIPSRPDDALRLGYDFLTWSDEKLVDRITPTNFFPTTDSDMPLELWRRLIGDGIVLGAGLELWTQTDPGGDLYANTPEMVYGFAAQYLYRGADRVYLFNHMIGLTGIDDQSRMPELLRTAGDLQTVNPARRRHVMTYCVSRPTGVSTPAELPRRVAEYGAFRLNIGGATAQRDALVILGLTPPADDLAALTVKVNATPCLESSELPEWFSLKPQQLRRKEQRVYLVRRIPAGVLHDGDNLIELCNASGTPVTVNWVEILLEQL